MLKLFRDYLFHQVNEDGRPWLDMSHIIQTLNKLDSGSSDTVNNILYYIYFIVKVLYRDIVICNKLITNFICTSKYSLIF